MTLIFDLDETLVSTTTDSARLSAFTDYHAAFTLEGKDFNISFRPQMAECLRKLHKHFELVLFTAGFRLYAEAVARILQQAVFEAPRPRLFDHVLHRDHCTLAQFRKKSQIYYYKDLRLLAEGRSFSEMVIVDNRAFSYGALHLTNGIPIKDYTGDKNDMELPILTQYLLANFVPQGEPGSKTMAKLFQGTSVQTSTRGFDVRAIIRRDFQLEKYLQRQSRYKQKQLLKEIHHARNVSKILQM